MKKLLFLIICLALVFAVLAWLLPDFGEPAQPDTQMQETLEEFGLEEDMAALLSEKLSELDPKEVTEKLRMALAISRGMTDEQLGQVIHSAVSQRGISLTEGQTEQLVKLCRALEKLDDSQLEEKLRELKENLSGTARAEEASGAATEKAEDIIRSAEQWLEKLKDKIKTED